MSQLSTAVRPVLAGEKLDASRIFNHAPKEREKKKKTHTHRESGPVVVKISDVDVHSRQAAY